MGEYYPETPYNLEDESDIAYLSPAYASSYYSPPYAASYQSIQENVELAPLSQVPSLSWESEYSVQNGYQNPPMHELARYIHDNRHYYEFYPPQDSEGNFYPSYDLVPGPELAPLTRTFREATTADHYSPDLEGKAYSSSDLL